LPDAKGKFYYRWIDLDVGGTEFLGEMRRSCSNFGIRSELHYSHCRGLLGWINTYMHIDNKGKDAKGTLA
jgi:hypothetical protein